MKRYTIKTGGEPRRFIVNYREELNDEQLQVVTAGSGPKLVIAGAGSGKTRTVTFKVARLLESGVPASRILLVTFTNRAARQMIARVESLVGAEVRRVWAGTFHSIGNRLLRRHAETLGYTSAFTIVDGEDATDFVDACIDEAAIDTKARRFPKPAVVRDIISFASNTDRPVADVVAASYPYFEPLTAQIQRVDSLYQERKLARNAMDYDDLLINWRRLMSEHETVSRVISEKFEYVLVDEYQDTNSLQAEIVDLVASRHRNLIVVGDDAQSIYGWRGAHVENMLTFKDRWRDAEEHRLETNYRSRPELLALANASIENNRRQLPKRLRAARPASGREPALVPLRDAEQQAAFVASRVLELRDEGVPLPEIAVLYRSHWHSLELQIELARRGIPYSIRSGVRFFEQAHIKDIAAYLRLVVNPRDELAWKRVLKLIPSVGTQTAGRIWLAIAASDNPLALIRRNDFQARPRASVAWESFAALISALVSPEMLDQPARQIEAILESGYTEHLERTYENAEARYDDLVQLARYAKRFESTESFLSELALVDTETFGKPKGVTGEDVVEGADEDEMMVLSTIHQAKGLEWRAVFLIWASDGKLPSARSLRDPASEEEERRLFYVAITRAKDELSICYPLWVEDRAREAVIQRPSRFVTEVSQSLLELWDVDDERALPEPDEPKLIN